MSTSFLSIVRDLSALLSAKDRQQRLVEAVGHLVPCDSAALLVFDEGLLRVLAATGLVPDALGRRYAAALYPRFSAILAANGPVRFAADDPRPDPFDGLIGTRPGENTGIHSCMGCALRVEGELAGILVVDAFQPGAFDGVQDDEIATFAALAAAALRAAALMDALDALAERRGQVSRRLVAEALQRGGGEIIGQSAPIAALREEIERVACTDLTVMILGETGTGKELVARTLHARSGRSEQPLVYVNCAALPESIAESELFGHVRGAFTGAVADRMGRFELADSATLFLDEVGELPLSIQPKLLRVLQQGEIQRVGADRVFKVNVRLIAATNRDLTAAVRSGHFRADLFHRLMVYPILVPPLRERGDDILILAGHFIADSRMRLGTGPIRLTAAARVVLRSYPWPGNVRELEHVILRAVIRAAGGRRETDVIIDVKHLDLQPGGAASEPQIEEAQAPSIQPMSQAVDEFQRRLVTAAVSASGGNWSEAARRLGMDKGNLHRLATRLRLKGEP